MLNIFVFRVPVNLLYTTVEMLWVMEVDEKKLRSDSRLPAGDA